MHCLRKFGLLQKATTVLSGCASGTSTPRGSTMNDLFRDEVVAPIDPQLREFVRDLVSLSSAPTTIPSARECAERARFRWRRGGPVMASVVDEEIPTGHGNIHVRRFVSRVSAAEKPVLVYLHGGGWTMFSLDTHDRIMRELAARADVVVVGVDYALSPESRFPVAIEQICDVVRWLFLHGRQRNTPPVRIAVGGDSCGANLAVAVALSLRDAGLGDAVCGLLLMYGCFDADAAGLATAPYGGAGNILTAYEMGMFWKNYLSCPADARNPLASPALADLRDLPQVCQIIAECDVLAPQNRVFAQCLRAAGVAIDEFEYAGATHSFLEAVSVAQVADRALDDSAIWLSRCLCATRTRCVD